MAIFKPPFAPKQASEVPLFEALHDLPDEWRVYGSVIWQSLRDGREGDGEVDFVLCHRAYGLLVVEVKGGEIYVENGSWFRKTGRGPKSITNPFQQITTNKYALLAFLRDHDLGRVSINHAVCFPHSSDRGQIGTYGDPAVTWWSGDLLDARAAVSRTIKHWNMRSEMSPSQLLKIDQLLAPTVDFKLVLADAVGHINKSLLKLTDDQLKTFRSIQRNRRAIVRGGPGTGKTLLSVARVKRFATEGFRVLWTCYNELLAKVVAAELKGTADALTFHSLCMREAGKAKIALPRLLDDEFWHKTAPELLVLASATNGTSYDAVIIDEGQDFDQNWIDALQAIGSASVDPPIYIFLDQQQQLYTRSWSLPNCTEFELEENCRNTRPIATRVNRLSEFPDAVGGADGPEPIFSELSEARRILDRIEDRASDLIENGKLSAAQITVLVDDPQIQSKLFERYAGPSPFVPYGQRGVVVETIARFKGLESDVVIVALTKDTDLAALRAAAYVGFSRAKALLVVVASPKLKSLLKWL